MRRKIQLMDVTVREGSYVISARWSAKQVGAIAQALDKAGIPFMEVGNAGGLGVTDYGGTPPQSTDVEQIRAAKKAVKRCKIGLLAGQEPYTKREHIKAVQKEVDFLRVAARIDDIAPARDNVEYARSSNIPVFFQMMRASKRGLKEIVKAARLAESFGSNAVYVVDTLGHFLPAEVTDIVKALKDSLSVAVGFHAHNNLMLAVANSLAAVEAGADFTDGSLLGFGRDAGNTQLEALVAVLQRNGYLEKTAFDTLMDAAYQWVAPIMPAPQGVEPVHIACAEANVGLVPLQTYFQIAKAAEIPFLILMRKLGEYPESEPDVKKALKELGKNPDAILKKLGIS